MEVATTPRTKEDVDFVDGIRGLAALSVVGYHSYIYADSVVGVPGGRFWSLGQYGVAVFIAVSGFLLGLPVARRGGYPAARRPT